MARYTLDTIGEFCRQGYLARVTCLNPACGHVVLKEPDSLLLECIKRRLSTDIDRLARKLRCGSCGSANAQITPAMRTGA